MVDVGSYGRIGDASIFRNSSFGRMLLDNKLDLPKDKPLEGTEGPQMPYCFVGDAAFGLSKHMMRPYGGNNRSYSQKVYDYR